MDHEIVAEGLAFPEGPVVMNDGSVIVVEVFGGCLTRIAPDGTIERIAQLGGGPNGAATGPNGCIYVCNNGGIAARREGDQVIPTGTETPGYAGGSIQRFDPRDGSFSTLYTHSGGTLLHSPNDIVFDRTGGMWFTDFGKLIAGARTTASIHYAAADGSGIRCLVRGPHAFNGIGLSPDESGLIVADTWSARLLRFEIAAPGQLASTEPAIIATASGKGRGLDSLAIGADGAVYVGALLPGAIMVVHADGRVEDQSLPDPYVTNIAFGGSDMRTAYLTLSQTGKLVRTRHLGEGLRPNFAA
ncbi:MAG: SMP-30/gluconolactonase/LRE family protein [Sphingobium sp.]